ncbi:hypothetical protein QLT00_gp07 [Gordonia phage Commandaria]|uniref:Uncharacterized protein n=1 Tax=Gordonia phage Commandaria TaxID=3038364 RepID=A0AAF0GHY3_9CAUD|nr:hypothetical protein QLT00_gp07 [Gordonia phage Commandaria]WGH20790.1 hypothetical protein [Gordonia phage Commandaria]
MTELAVRFLSLLGPISAFVALLRIFDRAPLGQWLPILIFAIVVNAATVAVALYQSRSEDPLLLVDTDEDEDRE